MTWDVTTWEFLFLAKWKHKLKRFSGTADFYNLLSYHIGEKTRGQIPEDQYRSGQNATKSRRAEVCYQKWWLCSHSPFICELSGQDSFFFCKACSFFINHLCLSGWDYSEGPYWWFKKKSSWFNSPVRIVNNGTFLSWVSSWAHS